MSASLLEKFLKERKIHTPDLPSFRKLNRVFLFVCDEFQREGHYNQRLKDAEFIGRGRTLTETFIMRDVTKGYPVAYRAKETDYIRGYLRGEVYAVRPDKIVEIDKLKSNKEVFKRETTHISLTDQKNHLNHIPIVKCFLYLGAEEFFDFKDLPLSDSSFMVNRKGVRQRTYYYDVEEKVKREQAEWKSQDWGHMMH